jgi:predicted lipid-binding transport protein (Tim44 family)
MRHIFLCSFLIFITFGLAINDAAAGRFGGGRGFGMMRSRNTFTQAPRAQKASAAKPATSSRWRGALTGLLLGGLLTSLFMGHGLGGMLFTWLLIGLGIYFIVSFVRRKKHGDCNNCN